MTAPQRTFRVAGWATICVSMAATMIALVGLAIGYRPVVITTGSMGDAAPPGSLVIARPVGDSAVRVGDILVMQRPGQATVTHRVVEVARQNDAYVATTKGDANAALDAAPYPLGQAELVERWTLPVVGSWLSSLSSGLLPVLLLLALVGAVTLTAIKSLWRPATTDLASAAQPTTSEPFGPKQLGLPPHSEESRKCRYHNSSNNDRQDHHVR